MIKTIITKPGEVIDFETVFEENQGLTIAPEKVGHWERVEYTTDVYEDGVTYPKYCNVYLPYGYDPEDKEKKYNVLYFQHGNTCDPDIFTIPEHKVKVDALFASEGIEPCILVATTYYFDVTKDVDVRHDTGYVPAGDGNYKGVVSKYYREIVEDIIPAVETKYNTYLTDASDEGIKATRDHRGFCGYSRGSVCTWKVFHYDFEYFRWFAPMSCHTTADHFIRFDVPKEEYVEYIEKPIREHPELPFFLFCSNGHPNDVATMTEQMKDIVKAKGLSYGKDPKVNNIYFALSEFTHTDYLVPYYLYNSLKVLFKA